MSLTPGSRLGPYEILSALGAGGMGEVYRARDSKLARDVALKVLPETFANDPERLARFQREAKTLASLNHPNIGGIYGLEEAHGVTALVMELVEGEDLAQRIARGPIPVDDALPMAKQIAEALEAAHEQGIVHRDLKPANIKVRRDGTVKVLDFGLAKAMDPVGSTSQMSPSPSITTPAMTQAGMILGTAAYMSPEQAKGKPADKRSDVWAFGCVLYEMLTGTRTFEGEDLADTLAFILTKEPDWTALPAHTPPSIRKLLRRCLEKERKRRLADIADARLEIDDASIPGERGSGAAVASGVVAARGWNAESRRQVVGWALGGVLTGAAIVAGAVAGWNAWQPARPTQPIRFVVAPPEGEVFAIAQPFLAISPDGQRLAFVTGKQRSENRLWIRSLDSLTAQAVPDTKGALNPVWSPDGRSIVFSASVSNTGELGRLRKIDVRGGPSVTLAEAGTPGAWSRDGVVLFRGRDGRIYRVADTGGGEALPVTTLNSQQESRHQPEFFLADQRRFVFQTRESGGRDTHGVVYLGSLDSPARIRLLENVDKVAFAQGHLVFQRGRTLFGQRFDIDSGRVAGEAAPIVENVDDGTLARGAYAVSGTGVLAYRTAVSTDSSRLTWFALDGKPLTPLALQGSYDIVRRPNLSPNGQHLAVTRIEGQGRSDVYLIDLARDLSTRFTFDSASDTPVWSPDGSRVVYTSHRKGGGDLYQRSMRGAGGEELVYESPDPKQAHAISPDGKFLLFGQAPQGNPEIWALPLTGEGKPIPIVKTGFPAGNAVFSPDGRWFAYCEGNSDAGDQVYVQPFPPNGDRVQLSTTTGASPQWSADGKAVVFTTVENRVMKVDVVFEGSTPRPGVPQELFAASTSFVHRAVLFDSSRARLLLPVSRQDIAAPPITVVVNAFEDFKRMLATR